MIFEAFDIFDVVVDGCSFIVWSNNVGDGDDDSTGDGTIMLLFSSGSLADLDTAVVKCSECLKRVWERKTKVRCAATRCNRAKLDSKYTLYTPCF